MIPEARAGEIVTVYEHDIDSDSYRHHSFIGTTFLFSQVYILYFVRYSF
jgi:hypothetical protein